MKWISGFIFALLVTNSFAQEIRCLDKLLPFPRPSANHQLSKIDWTPSQEKLGPQEAKLALESLLYGKLFCSVKEIEIKSEAICHELLEGVGTTSVCVVSTNLGNFIVNKDYQNNANFTFLKDKNAFAP